MPGFGVQEEKRSFVKVWEVIWIFSFLDSLAESEWLFILLACDFRQLYTTATLTLREWLREPSRVRRLRLLL